MPRKQASLRSLAMSDSRRVLLLDVLGTLVRDPFHEDVAPALGMSFEELLRAKHPTAWVEFELGELTEAEFLPRFFADGRAYDHAALKQSFVDGFRLLDGIEALLTDLNAAGNRPHLLSNYPVWYHAIEAKLRLSRFADWSFVSCDTRVRKPDADAFLKPLRTLEVAPSDCLFVDDVEKNVRAAAQLGITSIRFTGAARLREVLRQQGFLGGSKGPNGTEKGAER